MYTKQYSEKFKTAEEAVKIIKSGDWVDYGFSQSQPIALDKALAARKSELSDVKVRGSMLSRPLEIVNCDPKRDVFTYNSWFFNGLERKANSNGSNFFTPMLFRNEPRLYERYLDVDVAMLTVTSMDKHGYFNFSISNSASRAILNKAKIVILEINNKLPRALGGCNEHIHISEVDYIVEGPNFEPIILPKMDSTDVDRKIASLVMPEIIDGACIQLGIGGMPNLVGSLIAESDLKELGCHSEMLSDAYYVMHKAGKLTNRKKNIDKGKSVYAFALGSQELYDWIDNNPSLASCSVDYCNAPEVIGRNDNVVSINNCLEVDLYGQISSETVGNKQISGTGGQLDFVTGAAMSRNGKSIITFSSTFQDKSGQIKSRIIPSLPVCEIVTVSRAQAEYLVTEWGKVNIAGRSTWERAELLINIAHPDFREELIKEAERQGIWRKINKKR
jgi:butyryl-CoA:acetate CoA-transferase